MAASGFICKTLSNQEESVGKGKHLRKCHTWANTVETWPELTMLIIEFLLSCLQIIYVHRRQPGERACDRSREKDVKKRGNVDAFRVG